MSKDIYRRSPARPAAYPPTPTERASSPITSAPVAKEHETPPHQDTGEAAGQLPIMLPAAAANTCLPLLRPEISSIFSPQQLTKTWTVAANPPLHLPKKFHTNSLNQSDLETRAITTSELEYFHPKLMKNTQATAARSEEPDFRQRREQVSGETEERRRPRVHQINTQLIPSTRSTAPSLSRRLTQTAALKSPPTLARRRRSRGRVQPSSGAAAAAATAHPPGAHEIAESGDDDHHHHQTA